MELIVVALLAFGLGVLAGMALVIFADRGRHRRLRERADTIADRQKDLTNLYTELSDKMDLDPARLGIDVGKEYSVHKMQMTLDELRDEMT